MNPEDPLPPAPAADDLPEGPLHSERAGAGCLLGLGILVERECVGVDGARVFPDELVGAELG